jgi:PBP1b-binding outer membrane lipoprotein LpoB
MKKINITLLIIISAFLLVGCIQNTNNTPRMTQEECEKNGQKWTEICPICENCECLYLCLEDEGLGELE